MASELVRRRRTTPILREAEYAAARLSLTTSTEQASMRAVSMVAESAMAEVAFIKRTQHELEQLVPDATEALNLIASTAAMAVARHVARFGQDMQ